MREKIQTDFSAALSLVGQLAGVSCGCRGWLTHLHTVTTTLGRFRTARVITASPKDPNPALD